MKKRVVSRVMLTLFLASMLFTTFENAFSSDSLVLEGVQTWYWGSHTYIESVAIGDVDGDGSIELVTGGYCSDGPQYRAQLAVWDGATLTLEDVVTWHWVSHTGIFSVAMGDVDGDGATEIVTGGRYYDGTVSWAQLCVWDGSTLRLESVRTWYWVGDTYICAVDAADVDGDGAMEIVTGGYYYDGTRNRAQLCVWDGSTLALEGIKTWYWTGRTIIYSVAVGDVDGDGSVEIITGGWYAGARDYAQLCVWDGSTLALEDVTSWYWTSNTRIESVAIADVDGDTALEIVTGGYYIDGTRSWAQLCVWSGSLSLEGVQTWYWGDITKIESVALGDVDGDGQLEIVTGGYYWDGTRYVAQLAVWTGSTLALEGVKTWYWTGNTEIYSVAVADVDGDASIEIVTGGEYWDGTRDNAQLCVWGFT